MFVIGYQDKEKKKLTFSWLNWSQDELSIQRIRLNLSSNSTKGINWTLYGKRLLLNPSCK